MFTLTGDILRKICPALHPTRASRIAELLTEICPQYGINSADILHEFLANLCEECIEFARYEENLTYLKPERLMKVWPKRFKTRDATIPYLNNAKALAMYVYGKRQDLGNITREDGFTFRGSGPMQLTGKATITRFGNWMLKRFGIKKTPEIWAELLRTSDKYGIHSACWFFAIDKQLIDEAIDDKMEVIVRKISGGLTNYSERLRYYELCKKYIV